MLPIGRIWSTWPDRWKLLSRHNPEVIERYPAQAKGVKCALREPVESFHVIPKTLKILRVAFARNSLELTG